MALIVEDGSGVPGANSYIDVSEARAYADARGLSLPSDDQAVERLLVSAMDYLEARRAEYKGTKANPANPLQWPRAGVEIDGVPFPSDAIPIELKWAQAQLAVEQAAGRDLMPTSTGKEVISERVEGAVERKYNPSGDPNAQPIFTKVEAFLKPLLRDSSLGHLTVTRA